MDGESELESSTCGRDSEFIGWISMDFECEAVLMLSRVILFSDAGLSLTNSMTNGISCERLAESSLSLSTISNSSAWSGNSSG